MTYSKTLGGTALGAVLGCVGVVMDLTLCGLFLFAEDCGLHSNGLCKQSMCCCPIGITVQISWHWELSPHSVQKEMLQRTVWEMKQRVPS